MPFHRPPPPPPSNPSEEGQTPLLRLGGLWPSKSGKALVGSMNLDYVPRGADKSVGEQFAEMLQQAADAGLPIKFLVFENNRGLPKNVPYFLNVALGQPRPSEATQDEEPETVPDWVQPPTPISHPSPNPSERVPRPVRRSAPRR